MSKNRRHEFKPESGGHEQVEFAPPVAETKPDGKRDPMARSAALGNLLVATNPFAALDHRGRPCGACPVDPRDPRYYAPAKGLGEVRGYVGARQVFGEVTRATPTHAELTQRTERRDLTWVFTLEPFEVPDTKFYRRQVAEGALLDATKDYEAARSIARARSGCAVEPHWI
jgi:hypothetical protein